MMKMTQKKLFKKTVATALLFLATGIWLSSSDKIELFAAQNLAPSTTKTFTEISGDVLNPERGMYRRFEQRDDGSYGSAGTYNDTYSSGRASFAHLYFELKDEVGNNTISSQSIAGFNQALSNTRNAGLKAIIRFRYIEKDDVGFDPPVARMKNHIEQIASQVINPNKDVIAFVEAGFIGTWGEWHRSEDAQGVDQFGSGDPNKLTATQKQNRQSIRDTLLSSIDSSLFIQFRYPMDIKEHWYPTPLSDAQAFNPAVAQSRVAHHNDCLLANQYDALTYPWHNNDPSSPQYIALRETYFAYLDQLGRNVPIGGETCSTSTPEIYKCNATDPYRGPIKDMSRMRWTYLNDGFHPDVIDSWKTEPSGNTCYDTIEKSLGYRFVLNSATVPTEIKPGGTFEFKASITNKGWASTYHERPVFIVLANQANTYKLQYPTSEADPRKWNANDTIELSSFVEIPANIPEGIYQIGLWMPDKSTSLQNDARYSIRLASNGLWNQGTWAQSTGINALGTVEVSTTAPGDTNPAATQIKFVSGEDDDDQPCTGKSLADFDCDGDVDIIDYTFLTARFFKTSSDDLRADIASKNGAGIKDGRVDLFDYTLLVNEFSL